MKVTVGRNEHFNAAHRLYNQEWSDARNDEVFGLCTNPNYHGHNYNLTVKVSGEVDPQTGYVIDTKELKMLIRQHVTEYLDHKNLNLDVPEFKELNPTAEHIAVVIWKRLRPLLDSGFELSVILYETERNFVEYNGQ
jgi:6-pyruvoyltetrahydropterin/6-carboxytetrahydropterin synthase